MARIGLFCGALTALLLTMDFAPLARADDPAAVTKSTDKGADGPPENASEKPAETPGAGSVSAPLRFRRIFAPADRVQDWPRGRARYVPVDGEEFERLVKAAGDQPGGVGGVLAAAIVRAEYTAEFDGIDTLTGSARCEILHTTRSRSLLTLAPLGFALRRAWWRAEAEPNVRKPAQLGAGPDGQLGLLVDENGVLEFEWSLRGERDADGRVSFALQAPRCAASELTLSAPRGLVATISDGLIVPNLARAAQPTGALPIVVKPAAAASRETYRMLLGGKSATVLRLSPQGANASVEPRSILRETVIYDVSPRGVDVTAAWKLDVQGAPLRQLRVTLDPGLQLVSARLGEVDVPWSLGARADGEPTTAFLTLPEPLSGADRLLRLAAIGPLELDRACALPRIRAVDAFWQEGTYTLLVREPLAVTSFDTTDCRQTKYSLLPDPNRGEAFDVQLFSPRADVRLTIARRQRLPALISGATIEIGADEARAVLGVAVEGGSALPASLVADVLPGWTIDAVESRPAEALVDWRLATTAAGGELSLQFARGDSAESAPVIFLRGHRRSREPAVEGETARFRAEDLVPVQFRDAQLRGSWLALRPQEGYEVRVIEAHNFARQDFGRLSAEQAELFVDPVPAAVYPLDARRSRFTAFAQSQRPRYAADVRAEAVVAEKTLTESYALRITPDGSRVSKLIVQFSQSREEPVRWRLTTEGPTAIAARRLSDAEQAARDVPLAPETWELTLKAPRSAAFEIVATRSSPFEFVPSLKLSMENRLPISLATLPDATSGQGRLAIKGAADESIVIANQGLKPVDPVEPLDEGVAPDANSRLRACFEYGAGSGAGVVTVARAVDGLTTADAVVWRREIQSWEDAAGRGSHLATFYIQNAGRAAAVISPNDSIQIERVWRDGASVVVSGTGTDNLTVPLPADREFVTVVVEFRTTHKVPDTLTNVELPSIGVNLPVLQTQWSLRLPPGYELLSVEGGSCDRAPHELSWSQRLFGPLGRPSQVEPLDPLSWNAAALEATATQPVIETSKPAPDHWLRDASGATVRDAAGDTALWIRVDGSEAVAHLARRSSLATFAVAIFSFSLAAGLVALRASRRFAMTLLFVAAAVALIAPRAFAPVATGALWGISLALVWDWARRALPAPKRRESPSGGGSVSAARLASLARQALPVLLAAGWFAACDPLSIAQPVPTAKAADEPEIYRVFIPVDEDERPTKDKYQVPQELHDELRRRAGALGGATQNYFIESARYQVAINRDAATEALAAGDLIAQFEVEVLRPEAPVRLPLTGVRPGPVARQDGQVIDFAWEMDEEGMLCHFEEPGTYELELMLRAARGELGLGGLDIGIPRVARSTLEVQLPTDPPSIDVPVALGALKVASEGRKITAELGPVDRLSVIWNKPRAARGAPTTDIDAWLWMQIQPGSVILQARLDVKPQRTAPIRELRLSVDPRLRPLPLGNSPGLVTSVETLPMDPRTIRVELSRAIQEPTTLRMSFLVTGSSGVGQLQLPQLAPEGGKFSERVLAVSVDPTLEYEVVKVEGETALAIPEFLAHWGEALAVPQLATRLAADQLWTIGARPRESRPTARQTLSVSADETQALVRFEAQLSAADERSTDAGFTCRHRLRVPTELQVQSVSLLQDGIERVSRFTRDESGELTVLLSNPVVGRQQLVLTGWLPIKAAGSVRLPRVELLSADPRETTIVIYRQAAVHVSVEELQSLTTVPLPPAPLPLGVAEAPIAGRPVAAFTAQADDYGAKLVITNNRPRIRSTQISSISQESGGWQGRVEYRCEVSDGSLDAVRFKLPPEWVGPFEITPATAIATIETQGDERRLMVRPKNAIEGEYRFTARGPLRTLGGERFTTPTLIPAPQEEAAAFVLLPLNVQNKHVAWQVVGLRPERLPDDIGPSPLVEAHESYRVLESTAAARLQHRGAPGGETRITRCDVQLAWSQHAPARGVARFDVQPAGQNECVLRAPEGVKILELRVAGLVITAIPTTGGWRVPLDGSAAAQTVEIAFVGPRAEQSLLGAVELTAPWLAGPKVERTSWTVFAPSAVGMGVLADTDLKTLPVDSAAASPPVSATFGLGRNDHWEIAGEAPSLRVSYRHDRPLAAIERWLCALALASVGVALGLGRLPRAARTGAPPAPLDRRPLLALPLGVAAWIWISPGWIGMAIVGASLLAWAWPAARSLRAAPQGTEPARPHA